MFAYGVCVGESGKLERVLLPSLVRSAPDAKLIQRRGWASIHAAYNSILSEASELPELEGVVLLHDDVEIRDPALEDRLRTLFGNDSLRVIGTVGGRGIHDMPWWTAEHLLGESVDPFRHHRFTNGIQVADTVDGYFLALSLPAARTVRFAADRYRGFHGYDAEFCARVRAAGGDVLVTNLDLYHWASCRFAAESNSWHDALYTWRLQWSPASVYQRLMWATKRRAHRMLAAAGRWR